MHRFEWFAARLVVVAAFGSPGCAKAPPRSDFTAPSSSSTPLAPQPESAAELSRRADVELASVRPDDVQELVSLLDAPNPYLRAGALRLLEPHAARLTTAALRGVVARLVDPDPIVAKECLAYQGSRRANVGQGMMLVAAECAHNHRVAISTLAAAVLADADASALSSASVAALASNRNLLSELDLLVNSRQKQLTAPLQRALVEAEKSEKTTELDAALSLLSFGTIGGGEPRTLDALARISERPERTRALSALCVWLALSYPGAGEPLSEHAIQGYARLAGSIRVPCLPDSHCAEQYEVLAHARRLRAAAAPLLPQLVTALGSQDEFLRSSVLMVLSNMGQSARPAVPKIVAMLGGKAPPDDVAGHGLVPLLEVLGAASPAPASVTPAIVTAVRRHASLVEEAAAVLVTLHATLNASQRSVLRRAFDEACSDAGSIANFSFSRDERCYLTGENLKKLRVLQPQSG